MKLILCVLPLLVNLILGQTVVPVVDLSSLTSIASAASATKVVTSVAAKPTAASKVDRPALSSSSVESRVQPTETLTPYTPSDNDNSINGMIRRGAFPFSKEGYIGGAVLVAAIFITVIAIVVNRRNKRRRERINGRRLDQIFQFNGSLAPRPQTNPAVDQTRRSNPMMAQAPLAVPQHAIVKPINRVQTGIPLDQQYYTSSAEEDDIIARQWASNMRQSTNMGKEDTILYKTVNEDKMLRNYYED